MTPLIISGIGTGVGKTLVAAIATEALLADYWKPVQAGYADGTDSGWIKKIITHEASVTHRESYTLKLAASPHIAAREEGIEIDLNEIKKDFIKILRERQGMPGGEAKDPQANLKDFLIVEGAGGLMAPLNEKEFAADLFKKLNAPIILVSRNYLGSINHSLLSAQYCTHYQLPVAGWIFNDQYLDYEEDIVRWTGIPKIASIPFCENPDRQFVFQQAELIKPVLLSLFSANSQKLV